jgi:REP element-mobilizing transposase RayT
MDPIPRLVPWHAHATTSLFVHMVWSTRHRSPWLEPRHDASLAALLERKTTSMHSTLVAVGNAADHVHVVVQHPPRVSVAQLAHRLKGASSWALHRTGVASTDSSVWQVGYWAESVGHRELEALVHDVREQRARHRDRLGPEPWEANLRSK